MPAQASKTPRAITHVSERLNQKLFDLPRLSPAHDVIRTGPFKSKIVRLLWGFWMRSLAPGGRYFFLATAVFFGFGTASLEFQGFVPLAYAVIVWIFAFGFWRFARPKVRGFASVPPRVAAGETLPVTVEIEAIGKNGSPPALLLAHRLPPQIDVEPQGGAALPALQSGEKTRASFELRPQKRGVYELRGFRVESDFPFGILSAAQTFEQGAQLLVYPKFSPLDRMELPMGRRYQPGGMAFVSSRGESVEYIGNRDYREGDNVRDIDWRATARLNRPIVREYREEYFLRAAVVLDTHIPVPTLGALADFERAVSLCASVCDFMNRTDYLVDFLAAGPDLYHLLAGRGLASLDQMLDILACVDSTPKSPWNTLSPTLAENLEQITSVVCLFLNWDEARRSFAQSLLEAGTAVKIIVVRDATSGPLALDPRDSWPGEVLVLGEMEIENGVKTL